MNCDPLKRNMEHQKLFKGSERARVLPGLKSPFFQLLDEMPVLENAFCIWGSLNEALDDLVRFVRNVPRGDGPLKLVTGGMSLQIAYRISNETNPSASIS